MPKIEIKAKKSDYITIEKVCRMLGMSKPWVLDNVLPHVRYFKIRGRGRPNLTLADEERERKNMEYRVSREDVESFRENLIKKTKGVSDDRREENNETSE